MPAGFAIELPEAVAEFLAEHELVLRPRLLFVCRCNLCGEHLRNRDHYMVVDRVWRDEARFPPHWFAHLKCLQRSLGRELVLDDFTEAPINELLRWGYKIGKAST